MNALLATLFLVGLTPTVDPLADDPKPIVVSSPDGRIRAEVFLEKDENDRSTPRYRVSFRGRPVVLSSDLGIAEYDSPLRVNPPLEVLRERSVRETYTQVVGKRSQVLDHYHESVITLGKKSERGMTWNLILRVYDDGVGFRYEFPKQEGKTELNSGFEGTRFHFPDDAIAHALRLTGFESSHEGRYTKKRVAELSEGLYGVPMLVELPGTGWAAVAEANLTDHAGLNLSRYGDPNLSSVGVALPSRQRLVPPHSPPVDAANRKPGPPVPKAPHVVFTAELPHKTPWRVIMIGESPAKLVESDLILNLNEPCAIANTSWIRTGKTTFPWWNGFYEENVPFKMGLNTETAKYYIDFCAENGIPYHTLDGLDNIAWYGGTIVPYEGAGITKGIDGLDLQEVLRYAKSRGVKIRIWMHWQAAEKHMEKAFPLYKEWGIEGVMLDFMDRDDQAMVQFLHKAIKLAADNHLTINLHGVAAPTGLERTYPNLLNHEGVMNLEYDKWDKIGIPPEHELTVPFTRMLAGPMDFHQGSLRGVAPEEFKPRNAAPLVMGTPCRMLASYVVFQNHLPMMADYPSAYRGHPALPVMVKIPTTWDDTKCLEGEVGKVVAIARRSGKDWWVGAMTDRTARDLEIPLAFLGEGRFRAEVHQDDATNKFRMTTKTSEVGSKDVLKVKLAPAGGVLVRLSPQLPDEATK